MKKIRCPKCGMELIRLEPYDAFKTGLYEFWCGECNIDITIQENEEE